MEKEEKKADLEQLLNSLIEKGWKPRGIKVKKILNLGEGKIVFIANGKENFSKLRFLTVKESGLWQFVSENGMVDADYDYEGWALVDAEGGCISEHETGCREIQTNTDWGYRLIESSLKDESELEDFLLSNIKVDE